MPNISIFSGDFCNGSSVVRELLDRTGCKLVTEHTVLSKAVELSGMSESKIEKAFSSKTSVFNKYTHEKERAMAYLRLALAEIISGHNLLLAGYLGHLVPRDITHILRVCLIADIKFRLSVANREQGLNEKEATKLIATLDNERSHWTSTVAQTDDPWSASLYDMVIPMDKTSVQEAAVLVEEYLKKDVVQPTATSEQAVKDFQLSARAAVSLINEGHDVSVAAKNGDVAITINKHVLMLSRLVDEIRSIVDKVPGVKSVNVQVGKDFHKANVYRKFDFEAPSKVLLVDDEREFVKTLSERLILRDMGSAVAHDGEAALKLIAEDEPEVLVLDLKMPGIDGIEVLRRVKETKPEIEVIILTGHGSAADKELCMKLGAFAYMHKPVDIEQLSKKVKEANEKVRQKKGAREV